MNQEKFGRFIKEIRKKHHLTQKQLAEKYNVTYQAVSKWENGLNMPDTSLMKQMSKDFNISLDDIFEGKYNKKNRKKQTLYILSFTVIIISLLLVGGIGIIHLVNKDKGFEFKMLKANCANFNITGSIAYNNSKSSIYISSVSYCGGDDMEKYSSINCTLYEKNNEHTKIIDTYHYNENKKITLEEFLQQVVFAIDDYQKICKTYSEESLYLEIEATKETDKITSYKIPLTIESNCN